MLTKLNTLTTALLFLLGFVFLAQYALHRQEDKFTPKQLRALDVIAALTPKQREALKFVELVGGMGEYSQTHNLPEDWK